MSKRKAADFFKEIEQMGPAKIRSRFDRAIAHFDQADALLPGSAMEGTVAEIKEAIKLMQEAATNLTEMLAWRDIMGID